MKHMKRMLVVLLTLVLLCTAVPFAFAEEATIVDSGYCGSEGDGTNLTWTLDSEGTLTVSGEGGIKASAFHDDERIQYVDIENGVTSIEDEAFYKCKNLMRLSLGNTVADIGDLAFDSCTSLTSVSIPDSVKSIGFYAFCDCTNLSYVSIPKSIEVIEQQAFWRCLSLTSFSSDDEYGVLYNTNASVLIKYPNYHSRDFYSVNENTKSIGAGAFFASCYLDEVVLPEGLETIGDYAFALSSISSVTLPSTLKEISFGAFGDCLCLDDVVIKGLETEIDEIAFMRDMVINVPEEYIKDFNVFLWTGIVSDTIRPYVEDVNTSVTYLSGEPFLYPATIHCHTGSTAEAYAIEHGMDYELTHFFEGGWTYDWDNLVRWRKCIHCDARETEPLETETPGGAEIVGPADGDTSFDVEPVSTDYVLIQEALGEQNVVKAFDINLKNQDGVHVQPSGTVKVKLPGDFKTGDYKVYRVNADGTYTDMNAFLQGSHLVFYTDHFSLYVVVDESAQTEPDTPDIPDTPAKESKVSNVLHTIFAFLQKLIRILFGK